MRHGFGAVRRLRGRSIERDACPGFPLTHPEADKRAETMARKIPLILHAG
jgi:hypothetical protein